MTLNEFMRLNKQVGNHWFSPDTLAFFESHVHDFDESSGVFITSECGPWWVVSTPSPGIESESGQLVIDDFGFDETNEIVNSYLVAAATEMFEALLSASALLSAVAETFPKSEHVRMTREQIKTAIEKAEGEELG